MISPTNHTTQLRPLGGSPQEGTRLIYAKCGYRRTKLHRAARGVSPLRATILAASKTAPASPRGSVISFEGPHGRPASAGRPHGPTPQSDRFTHATERLSSPTHTHPPGT